MSKTITKIEQWEEAWAEYIDALQLWDCDTPGEDHFLWVGIALRRLNETARRLREIDPDFSKTHNI